MILDVLPVGQLEENCYLVGDEQELIIIDPGAQGNKILAHINEKHYHVAFVVLTHCHYDHIGAVADIIEATGAKLLIGAKEKDNYFNKAITLGGYFDAEPKLCEPDKMLNEGDVVASGVYRFKVLETPGHTSGSICLLGEDVLFSGDTLFYQTIGRADFPTGNLRDLVKSVKEKLLTLDDNVKVYSGHGPASTIAYEKEHNEVYAWERFC